MASAQLTLAEAAGWLSPPITRKLLGCLVNELGIEPAGVRRVPHRDGKPPAVYDMAQLIPLHAALALWLRAQQVTRG